MAKKKVFISFDYENDKNYKNLLVAWDKNKDFDFYFNDKSSGEIDSDDVSRVKAALTTKINNSTHTLVIIGKEANKQHKNHKEIGYTNWLNFEIAKSKANKNKLIGVKIDKNYTSPDEILNSSTSWAMSFTFDSIKKALDEA